MTIKELINQADEEIQYPYEPIIEHYWPYADQLTDYICVSALLIEEIWQEDGIGSEKKGAIIDGLMELWQEAPIPEYLRSILDPIFEIGISKLIDLVVDLLNNLFPEGWAFSDLAYE